MTNLRELLGEAIGKYGVQCSETKVLSPTAELTDLLDKVGRYEAALRRIVKTTHDNTTYIIATKTLKKA